MHHTAIGSIGTYSFELHFSWNVAFEVLRNSPGEVHKTGSKFQVFLFC